jgi:chromosome partitioning protein
MPQGTTIAFHSYKGGTGKTTLITNLAALYASDGLKVCLMDFDLYAPSLMSYFHKTPSSCVNDLLDGEVKLSEILMDVSDELRLKGKLLLGFSDNKKEGIEAVEIKHELRWQLAAMRRFLSAKNQLFEEYGVDYLFLDTSPGIRYWSINALAAADRLFLVMKDSDMDIDGTKRMINDIYDSLAKFGSKYYLILNKVPGASPIKNQLAALDEDRNASLEKEMRSQVVGSIPCFCDVQFNRHEFLWAVRQPKHPFSMKLKEIAEAIKNL